MAFLSMTGHGRGESTAHGWHAEAEVACVNRKQLDIVISLPRGASRAEPALQALVRERFSRCRVAVTLQLSSTGRAAASALAVDEALARGGLERLRALATDLGLTPPATLSELAALVPFARVEEVVPPETQAETILVRALRQALDQAATMRKREGLALQKDVLARIDTLEREVAGIAARSTGSVARLRDALLARLRESGLSLDASDERVAKEVVLFADRCDVSEELTRLASHFAQFRACAKSAEPVGRTLDFLCQELFREINTLGSKTADHESSSAVILLKTELERIREQVQNVE